jgi:hypothetical protein
MAVIASSQGETIFRPNNPPATRTVRFLLRSMPPYMWAFLYLLFALPFLWDNWEKLSTHPVPFWRWFTALLFPLMLFGLLCILQMAGGRRDPVLLDQEGLKIGRRGPLKDVWTPVACLIEPLADTPGVHRLTLTASTPLSRRFGRTIRIYSGITDDLEHAQQFARAFHKRYGKGSKNS